MSQFDQGEFGRGKTFYGVVNTIPSSSADYGGADRLGVEKWFTDEQFSSTGAPTGRSKRKVLCRLVRNVSGIALLGKRALHLKAGSNGCEVDGYSRTQAEGDYVISDEYLPAAGVRNGDIFWVVIRGPALVTTTHNADASNVIGQGDLVVVSTAANSTAHTAAGRFEVFAIDAASTSTAALLNAKMVINAAGRAQSAKTTGNTGADLLIDVYYHG